MDPLTKQDDLARWMARRAEPDAAATAAAGPGIFGRALDLLNRPVSSIMGGIHGAVTPGMTPLEGFMEGLQGQEQYGTYNLLTDAGMDPDSRWTHGLGLVGDVLNPLDPLNYVGFGFSKAGRLAKLLPEGAETVGKFATREAAALAGEWAPLTFAGRAVVPRGVSAPVARLTDRAGDYLSRTAAAETLGKYFGGVKKYEAAFPGISRRIATAGREVRDNHEQLAKEIMGITSGLAAKGLKPLEVDGVIREVAGLLESPEDKIFRLGREWELLDDASTGKFVNWRPEDVLDPEDLPRFAEANKLTQQQVDKRVGELMLQRRELGAGQLTVDSGQLTAGDALRAGKNTAETAVPPSLGEIEDELHVLQSVQVSRLAGDMPPEMTEILVKRRDQVRRDRDRVIKLWDEATDDSRETFHLIKPLIDDTRKIYEDILRPYDSKFEFPVADYLKHMFPAHWSQLPANVAKEQKLAQEKILALSRELAGKGYDQDSIAQMVRSQLRAESALVAVPAKDKAGTLLRGDLDAFQTRKVNMTIEEVKEAYESGALPWSFEDNSAIIAAAMRRDATRWKFGYDIHKFISEKPGWTVKGEEYAALSKADQKGWVPVDFHMPWIDQAKNPFRGTYMKREVSELMKAQMQGVGMLTNDEGLNGAIQALHGFRRWWTSWTLAPFPAFHVRNLVGDMIQSSQAGLSPLRDLAKAPMGESAYAASMAMQMARKGLPDDRGAWAVGKASLDNLTGMLSKRFGEPVTADTLSEWMEIEGVLGTGKVRDLDLDQLLSNDPLMKAAMKQRSLTSRAADWLPFQAPGRSPIIKAGFAVGEHMADYTRSALFFDALRKAAPEAKSLEDALEVATGTVRQHLFDYGDLTSFERDVMRLAMPFYTFSSKNIPLQVSKMMTEPGRLQWTARLYEGAWGQYDDSELKPEDLPAWLEDGLGLPMAKVKTEDGAETYAIWSPRGWLPQTELNEMADLIRGKAGPQLMSRLNPILKETFEQALNTDAYTMTQIDDGTIRDVLGVVMEDMGAVVGLEGVGVPNSIARRAAHLINNFRLVTEVDRLDPFGAWTKIGQHMGWWENERPHRWTAPGVDRVARLLVGWNMKGVDPEQQAMRNARTAHLDSNQALGQARKAKRQGSNAEAAQFLRAAEAKANEAQAFRHRLNTLRQRRALDVAARESGR